MRLLILIVSALVVTICTVRPQKITTKEAPPVTEQANREGWSFSFAATTYILPDDREYVQATFTADRGWLHLEARHNYENLDTGSVWLGYNFSGGKKLEWEFTPMLGGVFGDTRGIAPAYKLSVSYGKLEFSSEGELVFDRAGAEDSFFYNWSELSYSPAEWFRFGVVGQRTRAYQSEVDIQRGLLVGFSQKNMDITAYVFNLDQGKPTWVLSMGVSF